MSYFDGYDTLPVGRFARYIILYPASPNNDPHVCTLHTAHIDDFPPFEAISYVWGTPVKARSITCNGKIIPITTNLFDALLRVRSIDKPRTLWVDSICINQADPKEQGHQVSIMDNIYKKSTCTLICLGDSDHVHAHIVADLLADVDHMIQYELKREDFDWKPNSFPIPDEDDPLLSHGKWQSFGILLEQPWFRRGWAVQEAALSQDAHILWAKADINWLRLVRVYIWCRWRALMLPNAQLRLSDLHLQSFYIKQRHEAITFRPEGYIMPLTFLEVLDCARWLGVTDPRDRIYAFQSLANPTKPFPAIRPNYEVPYLRVYQDFACKYLRLGDDLDILHFVHNDGKTLDCDFPSWIPRWDMHLYSDHTGGLNNYDRYSEPFTSRLSDPKITLSPDQSILGLAAIIIDTVTFSASGFDKKYTTPSDVASLWDTVSKSSIRLPYSCSSLRSFVTIFRCGVYRGRLKEWEKLESAYMQLLQQELSIGDASYDYARSFHEMRMEDVHNKSFILSNRGYYGLAPQAAKEGDVCCIIFGTRSPFILRRTPRPGYFKLVGSALILSKHLDHNGNPEPLSRDNCDWIDWGLEEENIFIC